MTAPATLWLFIIAVAIYPEASYAQTCGDGMRDAAGGEQCDFNGGVGCNASCFCSDGYGPDTMDLTDINCLKLCGNGVLDAGEECDDGNTLPFDGCSVQCTIEDCSTTADPCTDSPLPWDCTPGMLCTPHCGDKRVVGTENCDGGANCNTTCVCDTGYEPSSPTSVACISKCGNGVIDSGEQCDGGYKCQADCTCASGYESTTPLSNICQNNCGDNVVVTPEEQCDSSLATSHCLANCTCDANAGYPANGMGGCGSKCGDGIRIIGAEDCDGVPNCNSTTCTCFAGYEADPTLNQCNLTDFCAKYPVTNGNCTPGVDQRTISCDAGYYAQAPTTPTKVITGDTPGDCTDINECTVYGCAAPVNTSTGLPFPGNIDANNCSDSTDGSVGANERVCTCGPGYYALQAGSPINTYILNGSDLFNGCSATCGNSILDPGEQCDSTDNCSIACTCNEGYEPNTPTTLYCRAICGNGILDSGEQCDSGLGCAATCTCDAGFQSQNMTGCVDIDECEEYSTTNRESCSNDAVPNNQATIVCDEGYYAQPPDNATVVLVGGEPWPGCQDIAECTVYGPAAGTVGVESCDDTLAVNSRTITCEEGFYASPPANTTITLEGNALFSGCLPDCGNGVLDAGEECDAASSTCETNCTCKPGYEPSEVPDQIDCQLMCGNGVVDESNGEECDSGTNCGPDCQCDVGTIPDPAANATGDCVDSCGNGILDSGEQCDSSAADSGCTTICTCDSTHEPRSPPALTCELTCGNGILNGGEECDSTAPGSGCVNCLCSPKTTYESIGNLTCGLICGNGVLDSPEECDVDGGAHCEAGCVCASGYEAGGDINCIPICGNGKRDSGEDCDPEGGTACNADCTCQASYQANDDPSNINCQPICGNARLDTGEQCDPNGGLYCNTDCTCFVGFEKDPLPSTDCVQILGCDVYGYSGNSNNTDKCVNGVNTRTIYCNVGYYAVPPTQRSIQLTGSEAFDGCHLIDQCAVYGFSGFPDHTFNCTGDVSQRTIYCDNGYYVLPQQTTSIILGDGGNFTGCEEIHFCSAVAYACGDDGVATCTESIGSRTCTCPANSHVKSTYTQSITYVGFDAWTPADDCQQNAGCALTASNLAGCGLEAYEGLLATCVATDPNPIGRICTCPAGFAVTGAGAEISTGILPVLTVFPGCTKIDQCTVYGCDEADTHATCDVGAFRDSRVCTCPPYTVNTGGPYFHAVILYHGLAFAGCRTMPDSIAEKAEDFSNNWEALAGALEAQYSWLIFFKVIEPVSDGDTRISVEFQIDTTGSGLSDAKKKIDWFISDWLGVMAHLEDLQGTRDGNEIFPATLALYVASTNTVVFSLLVGIVATLMHLL